MIKAFILRVQKSISYRYGRFNYTFFIQKKGILGINFVSKFIKFASNRKYEAKHLKFADEVNENLYQSILNKCIKYKRVGVVGVSFKPNSPVVIGSPSARLISDLVEKDIEVFAYDELEETFANLNGLRGNIVECKSPQACVDKSDIVAIMRLDNKFSSLDVSGKGLIDYWGTVALNPRCLLK